MSKNDQLLKALLDQQREESGIEISRDAYFNFFVAEQVLKDADPTDDEIENGIVDGPGDGGIDGVYFFINGTLISEDTDTSSFRRPSMDLLIIQSKNTDGFPQTGIQKVRSTLANILALDKPIEDLSSQYSARILAIFQTFRETYTALSSRFPKLTIHCYFASHATEIHPNFITEAATLDALIQSLFSDCDFRRDFLTSSKLLDLARKQRKTTLFLRFAENPISTGQSVYVCLVTLNEYFLFISDEHGKLRTYIFESNVRDYQGPTEVNTAIRETLRHPYDEDF